MAEGLTKDKGRQDGWSLLWVEQDAELNEKGKDVTGTARKEWGVKKTCGKRI